MKTTITKSNSATVTITSPEDLQKVIEYLQFAQKHNVPVKLYCPNFKPSGRPDESFVFNGRFVVVTEFGNELNQDDYFVYEGDPPTKHDILWLTLEQANFYKKSDI